VSARRAVTEPGATAGFDHGAAAVAAWRSLRDACLRDDGETLVVTERAGGTRLAPVWPVSQVLSAAIDLAVLTGDDRDARSIAAGLERYRRGAGYTPRRGNRRRYYDDNAWIGLDLVRLAVLSGDDSRRHRARALVDLIAEGQDADGGVRWAEGRRSRHTCATAPAAQLALQLSAVEPDPGLEAFAGRGLDWLDRTLARGPLYADHVEGGTTDETLWTYNQGSVVGAKLQLHLVTGDPAALSQAMATARASLARFDDEAIWRHPPVFNAIWLRNLSALDAATPVPGLRERIDTYLDRAWTTGRDDDGLFTAGGIGAYDGTPAIDHAGVVQLFALRA